MEICILSDQRDLFDRVIALHDLHKATLGFFPRGAFREYYSKGQILTAVDDDSVLGFLTFRITGRRCCIVHLCAAADGRCRGVARGLLDFLKQTLDQQCLGIHVRCRRDYEANRVWPRLGFVATGERAGRGKDGKILTEWWLDFIQSPVRIGNQCLAAILSLAFPEKN